ncbi:longitudinals lacking protein, isoforms N/O/W/X/Y-like [Diaphorina citri]|uniref:Longitudinals lacking protein, isoforms N/O/W/X/Y-like n=1 Tax=Diaphorina citri TaxID=121845 RepID=A0A3Q0JLQ9_DIACI|nr:longitudinals lacking protein, isoforms N/O/W/X/Y-like [Diaphorina citri]
MLLLLEHSFSSGASFSSFKPLQSALFMCESCHKTYKAKGSLERHKKFECGKEAGLQCPFCPYKSKHKSNLKTHMAIRHQNDFTNAFVSYRNFSLRGTQNSLFACDVCHKSYKNRKTLVRHKDYECGKEPHLQCSYCTYRTKHNCSLKTHMAIRHS